MKTFPFYKQPDQMDCGPTCLRMIAKHYGKNFNLQKLREVAGINKEGVSLLGISEAAEKIGFRTMGSRLTLHQLRETELPVILHWNQNHFVILFKIKTKKANGVYHFADPAKGIIQYTETEFLKNWLSTHNNGHNQGIALMLSTTPAFYGQGGDKKMALDFGFLLRYTPSLFFEKTIIN